MRETTDFHDSLIRERRYALLQAAATLTNNQDFTKPLDAIPNAKWFEVAVAQAEKLLAEIEKLEKDQ